MDPREEKLRLTEHAERRTIFAAARMGHCCSETCLYCLWYACPECARAIIDCGIRRVCGHRALLNMTPPRWAASVSDGLEMLHRSGIVTEWYDGPLGVKKPIRFDGKLWNPSTTEGRHIEQGSMYDGHDPQHLRECCDS